MTGFFSEDHRKALEAALKNGTIVAIYVIDEPYRKERWAAK